MGIDPGTTLGHYEIVSSLGRGGMGEVYRARDTKLGREVALKLVLEEVAADPERLARFEREALVLASLNHNRIATLHGFEAEEETSFLVMELVSGETLAERIARGPVPVEEAIELFVQIAEGLEAAHEKGVIHRDLKPANIKVTDEGDVKILDFGLAKAMVVEEPAVSASQTMSPTLTLAATMRGEILGTAAYMSPEQASGKPVDKRTDVWAFGVCLWEAVTGRRVFQGEDAANTLAAVLRDEIDFSAVQGNCPRGLRRVLERCLVRDRRHRLHDIADARLELQKAREEPREEEARSVSPVPRGRSVLWRIVGVAVVAAVAGFAGWMLQPDPPTPPTMRFSFTEPGGALNARGYRWIKLSRDGRTVAFTVLRDGTTQIYTRSLEELGARPIRGSEGSFALEGFSPDGQWVLFGDSERPPTLKKVRAVGGSAVPICPYQRQLVDWGPEDTIVLGSNRGLLLVSAAAGEPRPLTASGTLEADPTFLPGGRSVLFFTGTGRNTEIGVFSLDTGERKMMFEGSTPRFVRSGHLVFAREGWLWAVAFDALALEPRGEPIRVLEGIEMWTTGAANYDIGGGSLAYVQRASNVIARRSLVWVQRDGSEEAIAAETRAYAYPRLSPDGTRLGVVDLLFDQDVWALELDTGVLTRLTFDPAIDTYSVWLPDGREFIFGSTRERGVSHLYRMAAQGQGSAQRLVEGGGVESERFPSSISPDGRRLVYRVGALAGFDLGVLSLATPEDSQPLLDSEFEELHGEISPDGRWLAYTSDESGRREVYVRPFPEVDGGKWQISSDGGESPLWSPVGSEIFYRMSGQRSRMMAVPYQAGGSVFRPGTPEMLFEGDHLFGVSGRNYDVSPDGQRFLMIKGLVSEGDEPGEIVVVVNFDEELKRLVPVDPAR